MTVDRPTRRLSSGLGVDVCARSGRASESSCKQVVDRARCSHSAGVQRAFVAGATGLTGRFVVEELVRRGVEVHAHVRSDSPRLAEWRARAAGIVTDRDLMLDIVVQARDPQRTRLGAIMQQDVATIDVEASIEDAVANTSHDVHVGNDVGGIADLHSDL